MELEKKYISKKNWRRVITKKEVFMPFSYKNLNGEVALVKIEKVTEPLYKEYGKKIVKIADDGYFWLQIGIKNKNYWITAMYDDEKRLIQYYIDITRENIVCENGESYFYDLFLDIVQLSNGDIFLLDEDELAEALENKTIGEKEYLLAHSEAKNIIRLIEKGEFEPINICDYIFENIYCKLKEGDNRK